MNIHTFIKIFFVIILVELYKYILTTRVEIILNSTFCILKYKPINIVLKLIQNFHYYLLQRLNNLITLSKRRQIYPNDCSES